MKRNWIGSTLSGSVTLLLLLAGCAGGTNEPGAGGEELFAYGDQPTTSTSAAPQLVNTASILFPLHPNYLGAIEDAQTRFYTNIRDIEPVTFTTATAAEVRLGPGQLYEVATVLPAGTDLLIDGQVGSWYRIAENGGYVLASQLSGAFPDGVTWQVAVVNEGSSEAVDACLGGLTNFTPLTEALGRPYYAMHSYCGGEPILQLAVGDVVQIDSQRYQVTSVNTRLLFGDSEMVKDIAGDAFLHTCDLLNDQSRIIGLAEVK